jgi:hypothetical protein
MKGGVMCAATSAAPAGWARGGRVRGRDIWGIAGPYRQAPNKPIYFLKILHYHSPISRAGLGRVVGGLKTGKELRSISFGPAPSEGCG